MAYEGLPWQGELWLGDAIRLGPPSRHADWLIAPQVVIVDALVEGIGSQGVTGRFRSLLEEIEIILGFILGNHFELPASGYAWVCRANESGILTTSELAPLGYLEVASDVGMPTRGSASAIPTQVIERPDTSLWGIRDEHEMWVPDDIHDLWRKFLDLDSHLQAQILRAGNAYRIGQSLWPAQRTAYAAFMVVGCEALKPIGRKYDKTNIYHVVEGLLGREAANELRDSRLPPQPIRSALFHRGERHDEELVSWLLHKPFSDPTFDETVRTLGRLTRTCLIEWLRRDGDYRIPGPKTRSV